MYIQTRVRIVLGYHISRDIRVRLRDETAPIELLLLSLSVMERCTHSRAKEVQVENRGLMLEMRWKNGWKE